MKRKIVSISSGLLKELPEPCCNCSYWESSSAGPAGEEASRRKKEEWFGATLADWGECGKVLYQDSEVLAYAQYGPGFCFPRTKNHMNLKMGDDALFLSCLYVAPEIRGRGLGKILLRAIEKDLYRRNFKALETIAGKTPGDHIGPSDFYLKNGFFIKSRDNRFLLMRIEFKSIVSWPVNLQAALDSLVLRRSAKAPLPT